MTDHWFHLKPAEFPKEEGALIQMAWYLWDCEEIMLDYYESPKRVERRGRQNMALGT